VTDLSDPQKIERARRAEMALNEFLDPAFELVADIYAQRLEDIASATPWEANKITALANALRIAKEVRGQIQMLVTDGAVAKSKVDFAKRVENLSPAKRRLLNIGL
jgi:hypothetical protein